MDYEFKTTFWMDFSIADKFGINAIKDTYNRAFNEWKNDVVYLTELVLVMNWKLWDHYNNNNHAIARVYDELWRKSHNYACNHLKGEDLSYYLETVD